MHRSNALVIFVILVVVGLGTGGYVVAQDAATPTPAGGLCATPAGSIAASPAAVVVGTPVQVPGSQSGPAASPTLLYPCATPDGAATAGGGVEVEVAMVDLDFEPAALTIPADTDVTLHFVNTGAIAHDFKIDTPEVYSGQVPPGGSTDLTINLPAGTYEYYCTIPGHKPAGMVGTLTVG